MSEAAQAQDAFEKLKFHYDLAVQHVGHVMHHINVARKAYLSAGAMQDVGRLGAAHKKVNDAYALLLGLVSAIEPCGPGFARVDQGALGGSELVEFLATVDGVPASVTTMAEAFEPYVSPVAIALQNVAGENKDVESALAKWGRAKNQLADAGEKATTAGAALDAFKVAITG